MFSFSKYKFISTPDNKVIAISTYGKKTVKGIAKTNPEDNFNIAYGKVLAAARCNQKVAHKRRKRARELYAQAFAEKQAAEKKLLKMSRYWADADSQVLYADAEVERILKSTPDSTFDEITSSL